MRLNCTTSLKETTSHRGNDYTTFKLQDPTGCGALSVFTWGHPTLSNGNHVQVEGTFETEHHQGQYTFYNELEHISADLNRGIPQGPWMSESGGIDSIFGAPIDAETMFSGPA